MLLSNEMDKYNTTITDDGLKRSPPLVDYSQDEIENSSLPNITVYSDIILTLVLLHATIHLLFTLALILLVLIIMAGIHIIQLLRVKLKRVLVTHQT